MKSERIPENNRQPSVGGPSEKFNFTKHLVRFWRDLQDDQCWKYDESSPVQLLEKLQLDRHLADNDEFERADFFWSRRPRFLRPISFVFSLAAVFGLPLWLFNFPVIGVPFLIISAVFLTTNVVQTVRWRRQYELSIDRLIWTRSM